MGNLQPVLRILKENTRFDTEAIVTTLAVGQRLRCVQENETAGESELIEEAKANAEALALLYRRYQPRISAYVARRIGDAHEAEDIVADVFLAMVRHLPQYRQTDIPFTAWLYRIAINEINRRMRRRRIRMALGLEKVSATDRGALSDEAEEVRLVLSRLPLRFQSVLSLHYLEQMSVEEVAEVLGCASGTVKSRLARGRDMLRDRLLRLRS